MSSSFSAQAPYLSGLNERAMNIEKHTHGQRLGIPNLYFQERVLSLTYPGWPVKVLNAEAGLLELVDVGDPLEAVAGDEHGDDVEADLR